ncbi:MAG: MFS transporter, partial [Pseudomonadota bacterium]
MQQPKTLTTLVTAEFVQRFSYWGLQSILVLFIIHAYEFTHSNAYIIYGTFTSLTFAMAILGGFLADRLFNFKTTVLWGIFFSLIGNSIMALSATSSAIYIGLACICYGTGIFISSNSNLLAYFYQDNDKHRDRGYVYLYIGTNLGGLSGPIIYGILYQFFDWHLAFLASIVWSVLWWSIYFKKRSYFHSEIMRKTDPMTVSFFSMTSFFFISILAIVFIYYCFVHVLLLQYLLVLVGIGLILFFSLYLLKFQKS